MFYYGFALIRTSDGMADDIRVLWFVVDLFLKRGSS